MSVCLCVYVWTCGGRFVCVCACVDVRSGAEECTIAAQDCVRVRAVRSDEQARLYGYRGRQATRPTEQAVTNGYPTAMLPGTGNSSVASETSGTQIPVSAFRFKAS